MEHTSLAALYEFTEEDLENTSDESITITLPFEVKSNNDLILLSYSGKLKYEKDWIIDLNTSEVTLKIKPRKDEIVQFFHTTE